MNTDLDYALHIPITLDPNGSEPLYRQLAQCLRQAISNGTLLPGARIENEIALADRLGVSRPTARRGIQELVAENLLVRRRGIGTRVVHSPISVPLRLSSLFEELNGYYPETRVLTRELTPATSDIAAFFGVDPGSEVFRLRRLRLTAGAPLAILVSTLPPGLAGLETERLETGGLTSLLRERGFEADHASQNISARTALPNEAALLGIAPGSAVLTTRRSSFDAENQPIEWAENSYRTDLFSYSASLSADAG